MSQTLPVTILTGFLGSGKTTLLNRLLPHPQMGETAVIINELGDIGLDHLLVETVHDDVVVLPSGCLCCTVRSDLVTALRDLFLKRVRGLLPEFQRLVIETTGLADPAPVLHTLMTDPLVSARYRLDGVVTVVDAALVLHQLDHHREAVKQIAVADRLVLSKTDLVDAAQRQAVEARLRQINPAAPLLTAVQGEIEPNALLNAGLFSTEGKAPDVAQWLREEDYRAHAESHACHDPHCGHDHHHHHHHAPHDDQIHAFCLTTDQPVDWDRFMDGLERLVAQHGEHLLRLKGIIACAGDDGPTVIHGVQHIFHPPVLLARWPDADHRSRLVIITQALSRETVQAALGEGFV